MTGHFTRLQLDGFVGIPFEVLREVGWTGVDLFFVLSGFLITGVLLRTNAKPNYLRNFFARRALRIVPLYFLLLLLYTVVFPLVLPADNPYIPKPWITDPIWYWTFLSNFYMFNLGRFPDEVMSVSWSLAVEEQFYLVWPLAILFCKRQRLVVCCVAIILSAIITRAVLYHNGANFTQAFVFPFARMDSLAIGALAAYAWSNPAAMAWYETKAKIIVITSISTLAACYAWDGFSYYFTDSSPQHRITSILLFTSISTVYGTILLHLLQNKSSKLSHLLSSKFLALAGMLSYAMYLTNDTINHTLIVFGISPQELAGGGLIGQLLFYVICFPITFAVGWACFHGVEKHFLKFKRRFT